MCLQILTSKDKGPIKEFQEALESGDMEEVIERHGDIDLLRFLQHRQRPASRLWSVLLGPHLDSEPHMTLRADKAWRAINRLLKGASLPLLLEITALDISRLCYAIRVGMIKQLILATKEDLESLTANQRQQLVRFTLNQLRPTLMGSPNLEALQRQAATLGYLALATLREPGAERPNRRSVNAKYANLSAAIKEYLVAMKAAS